MIASEKRLDQMDRLTDMGHFPVLVNAGATANVLATIAVTWWLQTRFAQPLVSLVLVAVVLTLNLLPVVLLRLTLSSTTVYPQLGQMDFVRDQHKFSDWVYLAASANMAFWVLVAWALSAQRHTTGTLAALLVVAALATFSPVLLRKL